MDNKLKIIIVSALIVITIEFIMFEFFRYFFGF